MTRSLSLALRLTPETSHTHSRTSRRRATSRHDAPRSAVRHAAARARCLALALITRLSRSDHPSRSGLLRCPHVGWAPRPRLPGARLVSRAHRRVVPPLRPAARGGARVATNLVRRQSAPSALARRLAAIQRLHGRYQQAWRRRRQQGRGRSSSARRLGRERLGVWRLGLGDHVPADTRRGGHPVLARLDGGLPHRGGSGRGVGGGRERALGRPRLLPPRAHAARGREAGGL